MEAGSAVEDPLSSGLSSVEARSVAFSKLDDEAGGAAGAVVLGAEVAGDGCVAAGAVLPCETICQTILLLQYSNTLDRPNGSFA